MNKKLYLHIGYPRTATTTFQRHLYSKHPEINYFGKFIDFHISGDLKNKFYQNINYIFDEILNQTESEYLNQYNKLLNFIKKLKLDDKKINLFSEEYIILKAIYYKSARKNKLKNFLIRVNNIFMDANIDIFFIVTIRKQSDFLISLYNATYTGASSNFFSPLDLIDFFKNKKIKDERIKIFIEGLLYFDVFKDLIKDSKNVNFFIYEEFKNDKEKYLREFSDYLNIDFEICKKLLHDKDENSSAIINRENPFMGNIFQAIYFKMKRNLSYKFSLKFLITKIYGFLSFLFYFMIKKFQNIFDKKTNKELNNHHEINLYKKVNINKKFFKENEMLITNFYHDDLNNLSKEIEKNLKNYL